MTFIALLDASGYRVPVNLGWVPGDPTRRSLPVIELPHVPYRLVWPTISAAGCGLLTRRAGSTGRITDRYSGL